MNALNTLTDTQAAYIAGIIDGESYIGLSKNSKSFTLRVAVKTTAEALTEWLTTVTGSQAPVRFHQDRRTDYARRPCHEWRVFGDQARQFLEAVRPYLVLKGEQARLAIEYQTLTSDKKAELGTRYWQQIKGCNLLEQGRKLRSSNSSDSKGESQPSQIQSDAHSS